MRLGWFKRAQPQNSTAAGYTAAVEAAAWARVNQSLRAERLGVSESCAALIERTLLSAELTGAGKFEMSDLAVGVYHFVRRGEAVLYPVGGQLVWRRAGTWKARAPTPASGGIGSTSWRRKYPAWWKPKGAT